nr:riboflavin kinase isoform X1 [Anas platyrhynchos]
MLYCCAVTPPAGLRAGRGCVPPGGQRRLLPGREAPPATTPLTRRSGRPLPGRAGPALGRAHLAERVGGGRHPPPRCAGCAPGRSPLLFPLLPAWRRPGRGGGSANFSEQVVESFPSDISTGIYYGWACVGNGDVHKMVLSIGWNPFYKNTKKSVETHIIHTFKEDFYGEILSIAIIGYIRPEKNFDSLEALISAIQEDIEEAKRQLDLPEHRKVKEDNFFHPPGGKIVNDH